MKAAERLIDLLVRWPSVVLVLAVGLAIAGVLALPGVRFDASVDRLISEDDPAVEQLREAKRMFGNDDLLLVLQIGEGAAADPARLARLAALGDAIQAVPGVAHVWSLADRGGFMGHQQPAELARNPLYRGQVVSRDGNTAAILVFPEDRPGDPFHRERLVAGVRAAAARYVGPERIVVSGSAVVSEDIGGAMRADIVRLSALTALILAVILIVLFRSTWPVVLALGATGLATLAMLALVTAFGHSFSVLTTTTPTMILSIGVTYAVYMIEIYTHTEGDRTARARAMVRSAAPPVIVSAVTTMAGFASLATTHISAIREFAVLGTIGVAVVTVAALALLPAGFALWPPRLPPVRADAAPGVTGRFLTAVERFVLGRPTMVLAGLGTVVVLCILGATRLTVDTTFLAWLRETHPARRDFDEVTRRMGGLIPLYVVVDSGGAGRALEPEFLGRLAALERYVVELPHVAGAISLSDVANEVERAMRAAPQRGPEPRVVPAWRDLALEYLREEPSVGPESALGRFVTPDRRHVNVLVRADLRSSREAEQTVAAIRDYLRTHMGGVPAYVTGTAYVLYRSADEVTLGQVRGLGTALLAISAAVVLLVRSLRLGLLAIPTNVLPIFVLFGTMGALGVTLNLSTSLIASVCLGVIVDDTVHFVIHYGERVRDLGDREAAARETVRVLGRALVFNSVALSAAFLILATSSFRPIVELGWLSAVTMLSGLAMDLLLLPILLARFGPHPAAAVVAGGAEAEVRPDARTTHSVV